MPLYLAIPLTVSSLTLDDAVKVKIPDADRFHLQNDRGWVIKFSGTTVELSNHIGLTNQEKGVASPINPTIIVPVVGYYGRGPMDMWEWIKTRIEDDA